jgi:hypothetical protein
VVIITAQATGEYNRSQCSYGTSTFRTGLLAISLLLLHFVLLAKNLGKLLDPRCIEAPVFPRTADAGSLTRAVSPGQ